MLSHNLNHKPPRQAGSPPDVNLSSGPVRATKSFGLRPSPSTPQLLCGKSSWRMSPTTSNATGVNIDRITTGFSIDKKWSSMRSPPVGRMIRRSASFDTIATSYLCGEWPRPDRSRHDLTQNTIDQAPRTALTPWSRPDLTQGNVDQAPRQIQFSGGTRTNEASSNLSGLQVATIRPSSGLTSDKWTQTPDDAEDYESDSLRRRSSSSFKRCSSAIVFTDIRSRLSKAVIHGGSPTHGVAVRCSPVLVGRSSNIAGSRNIDGAVSNAGCVELQNGASSKAIEIPSNRYRDSDVPFHGSAEDRFSQEIEKLVRDTGCTSETGDCVKLCSSTPPDGHRAPLADLLNLRSVNTQTPSGGGNIAYCVERHFMRILEDTNDEEMQMDESPSSLQFAGSENGLGYVDIKPAEGLEGQTGTAGAVAGKLARDVDMTTLSSDPPLVQFVKSSRDRLPPDGCERIEIKMASEVFRCESSPDTDPVQSNPVKLSALPLRCHIPSERSAFCPLLKNYHQSSILSFSINSPAVNRVEAQ